MKNVLIYYLIGSFGIQRFFVSGKSHFPGNIFIDHIGGVPQRRLCEGCCAKRLSLDEASVKTCGYYHRIGKLRGENSWENVSAICEEYNFPPKSRKLLQEYVDEKQKVVSKETIVVLFSDCVVSSILYLFAKTPKAEVDYKQLVDTIFQKKMETSELWENEITLKEFYEMKKIFIEEKLYYDFLR